jgi:hypothetical protein
LTVIPEKTTIIKINKKMLLKKVFGLKIVNNVTMITDELKISKPFESQFSTVKTSLLFFPYTLYINILLIIVVIIAANQSTKTENDTIFF